LETVWIDEKQLEKALARNEAFWKGRLEEYPLIWITVPNAKPGKDIPEPAEEQLIWTDVDYVITSAENQLARTYYAGDSLPIHNPWLGPDQFAGWLGAELIIKPKDFTSWSRPFVDDWDTFTEFKIDPENCWWKLYLEILRASAEAGKGKWVTAYPDLHTGIDGLAAIRGPEKLMIDMTTNPEPIHQAMKQMTELWKYVVDVVSEIILRYGQGTSNWSMGWSSKRFLCIGQNDFSCLLGPEMFEEFCRQDTLQTCNYVDHTLYHLDGPDAVRHLPKLLDIESLDAIQWIQGAGSPLPSEWLDMLQQIQKSGKSVQLYYGPSHGEDADLFKEIEILCQGLEPERLFFWIITDSIEKADALVEHARLQCSEKHRRLR